jgi:hypothetical protein
VRKRGGWQAAVRAVHTKQHVATSLEELYRVSAPTTLTAFVFFGGVGGGGGDSWGGGGGGGGDSWGGGNGERGRQGKGTAGKGDSGEGRGKGEGRGLGLWMQEGSSLGAAMRAVHTKQHVATSLEELYRVRPLL